MGTSRIIKEIRYTDKVVELTHIDLAADYEKYHFTKVYVDEIAGDIANFDDIRVPIIRL